MTPAENPPQMVMETLRCVESISIEISKFDMDGAVEWRTMFKRQSNYAYRKKDRKDAKILITALSERSGSA